MEEFRSPTTMVHREGGVMHMKIDVHPSVDVRYGGPSVMQSITRSRFALLTTPRARRTPTVATSIHQSNRSVGC